MYYVYVCVCVCVFVHVCVHVCVCELCERPRERGRYFLYTTCNLLNIGYQRIAFFLFIKFNM